MKRTIPDSSIECGYLDEVPLENITNHTDLMTTARLARGVVSMRKGIKENKKNSRSICHVYSTLTPMHGH